MLHEIVSEFLELAKAAERLKNGVEGGLTFKQLEPQLAGYSTYPREATSPRLLYSSLDG